MWLIRVGTVFQLTDIYRVWTRDEKILVKHLDLLLKQGQLQLNKNAEACKLAGVMDLAVNCTSSSNFIVKAIVLQAFVFVCLV